MPSNKKKRIKESPMAICKLTSIRIHVDLHVHKIIIVIVGFVVEVLPPEICDVEATLSGTWQRVAGEYGGGGVYWRTPPSAGHLKLSRHVLNCSWSCLLWK